MSMHRYLHDNLGIEPLPGNGNESLVALPGLPEPDFGNHETLGDEYDGSPEPLTDVDLPMSGQ